MLLKKDPSPTVRKTALHVFEDAAEMMSSGAPTNPREGTNEILRTRRQSRFRREDEPAYGQVASPDKRKKGSASHEYPALAKPSDKLF